MEGMIKRVKEMLTKPEILKAVVKSTNERKAKRVKPLEQELQHIISKIEECHLR
ncbi:hypothetical protein [Paenibacillus periandrae]|uniref:hypothetical protein n=1 Tax=Paenibacillus periandrae TaxID=1761741 RepID=UPI001F0940AA|nr:hypothetical protein [Paenibacillus periandrae]